MKNLRAIFASLLFIASGLQAANIPAVAVAQPRPTFTTRASNRVKTWWATITGTTQSGHRRFAHSANNGLSFIRRHKGKFALALGLTALGLYAYYDYRRTGVNPMYKAKASLNRFGSSIAGHWDSACHSFNENIAPHFASEPPVETRKCGICYDDVDTREYAQLNCGHESYCNGCLSRFLNTALNDKNTGNFKCPDPTCATKLTEADVRKITRKNRGKYNQFLDILRDERVVLTGGMKYCPTPDCGYYFINDAPLNFWVEFNCPTCQSRYCSNCLKDHDGGLSCTRAAEIERLDPNGTRQFNEWKTTHTRNCPSCHKPIQKNSGCKHMTCRCSHQFCWDCGTNWLQRTQAHRNTGFFGCPNPNEWWK